MPDRQLDTLARTIWGEARSLGSPGMSAVAAVIMNRADHPRWWGRDIEGVCLAPHQFSCWNPGDVNRAKLLAVTANDMRFAAALEIAFRAISHTLKDPTEGADSYYDTSIPPPYWAKPDTFTVQIATLRFYRTEL